MLKSIISFLLVAQAVRSSPILSSRSSGNISCSSTETYADLNLVAINDGYGGNVKWPVTLTSTSNAGQQSIEMAARGSYVQSAGVIIKQCNSTELNFNYHSDYYPGFNPIKMYFQYDITKCLQRDPSQNNQIVFAQCSDVDGQDQQYQFWDQDEPYGIIYPVAVNDGKESDLGITLSQGIAGNLTAGPQSNDAFAFST